MPEDTAGAVDAVVAALDAGVARAPDPRSDEIARHLLLTLLLWLGAGTTRTRRSATTPTGSCSGASPPCSNATSPAATTPRTTRTRSRCRSDAHPRAASGDRKGTKELVRERVLLEAARLLRFSDLDVGEVAFQVGLRRPPVLLARVPARVRRSALRALPARCPPNLKRAWHL